MTRKQGPSGKGIDWGGRLGEVMEETRRGTLRWRPAPGLADERESVEGTPWSTLRGDRRIVAYTFQPDVDEDTTLGPAYRDVAIEYVDEEGVLVTGWPRLEGRMELMDLILSRPSRPLTTLQDLATGVGARGSDSADQK